MDWLWDVLVFAFRFLAGRPLDGRPRSDATFRRSGTRGLGHGGVASRWALRPGWHRAGFRIGGLVSVLALVYLVLVAGAVVLTVVLVIGSFLLLSGTGYGAFRGFHMARDFRHTRRYVEPIHAKLSAELGLSYAHPNDYLTIPTDFRSEHTDGVRVDLPAERHLTPEHKDLLRNIVTGTLGMTDAQLAWHIEGNRPHVFLFPAPRPPAKLTWSDCENYIRNASATAPFAGLDKNGTPVVADLEADSPHILVSAGSGGGKSVLTKLIAAQLLRHGARVIILDFKRVSHTWAKDLPGVEYHKDVGAIHDALVRIGREGDRRNVAADEGLPLGERVLVVCEEMNATITKLQQYWDATREKDDPKRSPAVAGLGDVLFMGRQVLVHVLAIAQMMTARTLGGPEARENFATRFLTRYSVNAWKMLAPEVWPAPKRSRVQGRWQVVKGGEATELQVPYLTDDEARALALEAPGAVLHAVDQVDTPGTVPAGTELVGLREWHGDMRGQPLTLEALRKASQRDGFPTPARVTSTSNFYRRGELDAWKVRRDGVRMVKTGVAS